MNTVWRGFLLKNLSRVIPALSYFNHDFVVTFGMTTKNGFLGHDEYARMFGTTRELFGLKMFPNFRDVVGVNYLLKTLYAEYQEIKASRFGDKLRLRMYVKEFGRVGFVLEALYLNDETMQICAAGRQKIAHVSMDGKPIHIPEDIMGLLSAARREESFFSKRCSPIKTSGEKPLYDREFDIANHMTNAEGNVSHDELVRLFSSVSEFYFLEEEGISKINIWSANYSYFGDIYFGETMIFTLHIKHRDRNTIEAMITCAGESGSLRAAAIQNICF
jgi:acyl-CoA thioesterase FadM